MSSTLYFLLYAVLKCTDQFTNRELKLVGFVDLTLLSQNLKITLELGV